MERHDHVRKVEKLSASRYDVTRHDRTKIRVFMTDVYEFTVSDYAELCNEYPDVNCIVQASTWNHFTSGVREEARSDDVDGQGADSEDEVVRRRAFVRRSRRWRDQPSA